MMEYNMACDAFCLPKSLNGYMEKVGRIYNNAGGVNYNECSVFLMMTTAASLR